MNLKRSGTPFGPAWPQGVWPTEVQESLLRACLLADNAAAQQAFRDWSERVPLFFVDEGSHRQLLLLYERLRTWNVTYADMERLKGMARYYWVRHQCLVRELHELTLAFQREGLDALLLKGAALNATVYTGGTRLMSDLDIAVGRHHADEATAMLKRLGWKPQLQQVERLVPVTHGCQFCRGEARLDLHWDILHGKPLDQEGQRPFWEASLPISVGGATVRVLSPTDQLLHTCEHGMRANETPPFRWLADACLIVRHGGVDWERLAKLAEHFQLLESVTETLRYLDERLATAVPREAFLALAARRSSLASRIEFSFTTRRMPGSHPFWRSLPNNFFDYRRARRAHPGLTLVEYLSAYNHFETPFWDNFRPLVKLQSTATLRWVAELVTRWSSGGTDEEIRVDPCDDDRWQGFCPPEHTRHGICRWSNTNASVLLPVRVVSTVVVRLADVRPWHGDLDQNLTLRVNRSVVAPQNVRFDDWDVSFDIEPTMLADFHSQRLELRCTKWDAAVGDPRDLGVPVREILLQPKAA